MKQNSKYSITAHDKPFKTSSIIQSPLRSTHPNLIISTQLKKNETSNYHEYNQFREYRDLMIRKITPKQINQSFLEIRQLISSLKDVAVEQNDHNNLKSQFFKPTSPSINNSSPYYRENDSEISYVNNTSIIKSRGSPLSVGKKGKKAHKDQVSKLLTNLHIYLNNNLSEINDLKSTIKTTHNEKPLLSGNTVPKIEFFDAQGSKLNAKEDGGSNDHPHYEDPVMLAEKKVHRIEVEKLLSKIKECNDKENKSLEMIETLKRHKTLALENVEQGFLIIETMISGYVNEEVWTVETDKKKFFSSLIYEHYFMIVNRNVLLLYKKLSDEKESMSIECNSINEVFYFMKETPVDLNLSGLSENDEENFSKDEQSFTGFQIKLTSKNFLFLKINNMLDMIKLDNLFFLINLAKNNPSVELFFKYSKNFNMNSMNIIHDINERGHHSIKRGNASPSMTDLDLSNVSNNFPEKRSSFFNKTDSEKILVKKKSVFLKNQHESLNKRAKTATLVENPIIEQSVNLTKNKPPELSQSNILNNEAGSSKILRNRGSFIEKKDPESRYLKAVKTLRNGFCFLKYGKYGEPHERLVSVNNETNKLEWRDINKKKSNGNIEIANIVDIKEGDTKGMKKSPGGEDNFFSIVGKNLVLNLESGTEKAKKEFIYSLRLMMERKK